MATNGFPEGSETNRNVRHLTNELQHTFERRARMDRTNAVDEGDEHQELQEGFNNTAVLQTEIITASELEGTQNNNNNCHDTYPDGNNLHSKSMTELNNSEVVKHKPPKYPILPTVSTASSVKLKSQLSFDDPFSADFENAIGDTIVEDAELEWDHSPDTDINGDLSNTSDKTMMQDSFVSDNMEDLPLPPPPPDLMNEDCSHTDDSNEPPLPPPPLDLDPVTSQSMDSSNSVSNNEAANVTTAQDINPIITVSSENSVQSNCSSNHLLFNKQDLATKVKETAIDGDLDLVDSDIKPENSVPHATKQTNFDDKDLNHNGPSDSFQSALVTETPVINGGITEEEIVASTSIMEEKPPAQPLDVNVITITDSATVNMNNTNNIISNGHHEEPLSLNTIVRPKSYSTRSRRPYYENIELKSESGAISKNPLDGRRSRSAYYENTVVNSADVTLDQKPPPPQTLKLNIRPRHHYEEITLEPESSTTFSKSIPDTCIIPKSPILSPKKQSPSGSAKRVLFQLPNGHHNSDGEEAPVTIENDTSNRLLNVNDRHSFHGLMHSSSSDAVLRSPPTPVRLSKSQEASLAFDSSKSPILMDKTYGTISRKELNRHSTPPVLSPRHSSLLKKSTLKSDSAGNSPCTSKGLLKGQSDTVLLKGQSTTSSSSSSSTSSHHKKGDHVHGSADSDDSYFSDSDFDDDYDDVYNIDDDGMSSTSDFTSYSDDVAPRSPRGGSVELDSAYDVVVELMKTEKAYVERLHFLCRVVLLNIKVLNNVQEMHVVPPEALAKIFINVEKIFSLHSSTVLPLIEERVETWQYCPRLDDVMKDLIPHFGLYHEFVENFNTAMSAMSLWMERCPIFQKLILEVEKTPECRRLKVKQHFLEIVQRVPTYYDLLRNYSSHISDGSPERESVKDVLGAMSELVCELERELGKTDRIKKLKSVQQRLDSSINIVSPLRQLVKEGKIKSISSKTGKKLDRYLFLMDDMLLICTSSGLGGKHKLKFTLGVDRMQIHDSDNLVIPFTFYVQSKTRAIEFHCGLQEEKQCWVSTLQSVIDEYTKRKLLSQPVSVIQKSIPEEEIGKIAPKMEHPQGQSVCYICKAVMKKIHNCKGCGQVVCQKCSSHKIKLLYDNNKLNKVCDECFVLVSNRDLIESTTTFDIPCVKPSDPCTIAGYLQLSFNKGHTWHKRWLTLHETAVLFSFKNFKEPTVLGSLPLKRFSAGPTSKGDDVYKPTTFKVFNARRTYYLQADNADAMARWIDSLADLCERKA